MNCRLHVVRFDIPFYELRDFEITVSDRPHLTVRFRQADMSVRVTVAMFLETYQGHPVVGANQNRSAKLEPAVFLKKFHHLHTTSNNSNYRTQLSYFYLNVYLFDYDRVVVNVIMHQMWLVLISVHPHREQMVVGRP